MKKKKDKKLAKRKDGQKEVVLDRVAAFEGKKRSLDHEQKLQKKKKRKKKKKKTKKKKKKKKEKKKRKTEKKEHRENWVGKELKGSLEGRRAVERTKEGGVDGYQELVETKVKHYYILRITFSSTYGLGVMATSILYVPQSQNHPISSLSSRSSIKLTVI